MRSLAIVAIMTALTLPAQGQVLTRPSTPSRETLDRLGLTLGWQTRLKLPDMPETLTHVQILPMGTDLQICVQSQSGSVFLVDAQTGDLLWSAPVGTPFWQGGQAAFDDRNIFVPRRHILHALDRKNGRQRVYTIDKRGSRIDFGFALPSGPSAPLVATDKLIYVPMGDRAAAYLIPAFDAAELFAKEEYGGLFKVTSVQFEQAWAQKYAETRFVYEPLVSGEQISFGIGYGLLSLSRFSGDVRFRFTANDPLLVPAGQHEYIAYVGSLDATLYAVNMRSGRLLWRFFSPGPIIRRPAATDKYVFVVSKGKGMAMLDRETGDEVWRNDTALQFLAQGDRFIYAADRNGRLLVLDIRRGTTLGHYDTFDWQVQLTNEYTDRIFLAAHDGQLLCLYPKGSVTPLLTRSRPDLEPKAPDKKDPPKDKEMEKDKEEPPKDKEVDKDAKDSKVDKGAWLRPATDARLEAQFTAATAALRRRHALPALKEESRSWSRG